MSDLAAVLAIVSTLMDCSSADAEKASQAICRKPETAALLLSACGASTAAAGFGGRMAIVGAGTANLLVGGGGAAIGVAGLLGARRFCGAAVKQVTGQVGGAADTGGISPTATTMFSAYYPTAGGGESE